jgi:hypothetical protein
MRLDHPTSVHAQIFEAMANKSRITLHPPLTRSEFLADYEAAKTMSALPDSFGHWPSIEWTRAHSHVKSRITHAKLICGKYGVISPRRCSGCRERGTTSMVYHPELKNVGRALGSSCGECRDLCVKCDISSRLFADIVNGVEEENDAHPAENPEGLL